MARRSTAQVTPGSATAPSEIFEEIHTVMHLIRAEQYKVFHHGPAKLTHMEGKILGFFARRPGATLSDLAADSGRDKGQLARLIKTLRGYRLLTASENVNDKRSVRLQLTSEGLRIHAKLREELSHATELAIRNLSAEERGQLLRLLRRLRENFEAR